MPSYFKGGMNGCEAILLRRRSGGEKPWQKRVKKAIAMSRGSSILKSAVAWAIIPISNRRKRYSQKLVLSSI